MTPPRPPPPPPRGPERGSRLRRRIRAPKSSACSRWTSTPLRTTRDGETEQRTQFSDLMPFPGFELHASKDRCSAENSIEIMQMREGCLSKVVLERFLKNRNCEPRFLQRNLFIYCIKRPKEPESQLERNRNRLSTIQKLVCEIASIAYA